MRPRTITGNKQSLHRNILLILQPREKTTEQIRSMQSKLLHTERKVNSLLEESIEKLSTATEHIIPSVKVMVLPRYGDKQNLTAYLNHDQVSQPKDTRGVVYTVDIIDDGSSSLKNELKISHLVGIKVSKRNGVWSPGVGFMSATVETTLEKLPSLIHDIMLDVAMYHSWLDSEEEDNYQKRAEFSAQKAQFALDHKLKGAYGVPNKFVLYFPLASHCREGNIFRYLDYEALWKELMSEDVLSNQAQSVELSGSVAEIYDRLRRFHRDAGMLSLRRISTAIQNLSSGTYLLITTRRKPTNKKLRISVGNLLGASVWRKRLWRISPFSELGNYSRHAASGFVTLFKFRVP